IDQLINDSGGLKRLKKFNELLNNENKITVFSCRSDGLRVQGEESSYLNLFSEGYNGQEIKPSYVFLYKNIPEGMSVEEALGNEEITKQCTSMETYYGLNSIAITPNVFSLFNLKFSEGSGYSDNDIIMETFDDTLPLVLGYDYSEYCKIGDEFKIMTDTEDVLTYKVTGFLEKDEKLRNQYEDVNCNKYMLYSLPEFMYEPKSDQEYEFMLAATFSKFYLSFVYFENMTVDEAQLILSDICKKAEVMPCLISGASEALPSYIIGYSGKEFIQFSAIVLLICNLFAVFAISMALLIKIDLNLHTYAIHIINGATIENIKRYVKGEAAYFIKFAAIILFLAAPFLWFFSLYAGVDIFLIRIITHIVCVSICCYLIYLLTCIIPIHKLNKLDISALLRRKE
ncbi:MAG: permease, partial [Clostridia bacterium]|nr:permease [Clostridia bacterium]